MKYLRLVSAMLFVVLMASCNTTKRFEKLYYAKEYDKVIQSLAPGICRGDKNPERINLVVAAYHNANQADHERIQALKSTGQPDVWPEIYQRYCSMKGRNEVLACFPKDVKKGMNYVKLGLDEELTTSRNKAESFLVAKTNQLLDTGKEEDALEAFKYKAQLMRTNPDNPNIMELQRKGMLHYPMPVLLSFSKDVRLNVPDAFSDVVLDFDEGELPAYNEFHKEQQRKTDYFTNVWVVVKDVEVSPSRLDKVSFKESNGGKEVEVTDYSQYKTVKVTGTINFCEYHNGRVDFSVPFEVTSSFRNDYSTIKGDREACSAETLELLNNQPVPVPTDESMLLDAVKKLNDLIATELKK